MFLEDFEDGLPYGPFRYHHITKDDMLNGDGLRSVLWVAGCYHHCKGCQNPCTWDENDGLMFDYEAQLELFESVADGWHEGITLSGGDPLHPANRKSIAALARDFKKRFPDKSIWLYTGNLLEKNSEGEFIFSSERENFKFPLEYIDVIVDGKFEQETRKNDLAHGRTVHWRGSSNQRIIDVKSTICTGEIKEVQ